MQLCKGLMHVVAEFRLNRVVRVSEGFGLRVGRDRGESRLALLSVK